MALEKLKVVLRDSQGDETVAGQLIVDEEADKPFDLPAEFNIGPGRHTLEALCPGKKIKGENPRMVKVLVTTGPDDPVQIETFELED